MEAEQIALRADSIKQKNYVHAGCISYIEKGGKKNIYIFIKGDTIYQLVSF